MKNGLVFTSLGRFFYLRITTIRLMIAITNDSTSYILIASPPNSDEPNVLTTSRSYYNIASHREAMFFYVYVLFLLCR